MDEIKFLTKENEQYPKLLEEIRNAPKGIYVKGNINCLNLPSITVVGSRNMSEYGKKMTHKIVKQLTDAGICIVSGLAVGIDAVAHQTCLDNGGKTIAVLGSGLNKIYPPENRKLYYDIVENGGCVISEYEPDMEAEKLFFPARNRIVSGLSLGTLVIEATYRSGTSITAKFAFDQGKKVFCIPNSVGNKNSSGTLRLIKNGAKLITDGKDILYELGFIEKINDYEDYIEKQKMENFKLIENEQLKDIDEGGKKVYSYIKEHEIASIEIMNEELNMRIQDINMYVTILELKGLIIVKSGGNCTLRDDLYV